MIDVSMKSLKGKIAQNPSLKQQIAQIWGIVPTPIKRDKLFTEMHDPSRARTIWEGLSTHERQCLASLLGQVARYGIPYEQLLKRVNVPSDALEEILAHFKALWLIEEEEQPSPRTSTPVRTIFPYQECVEALFHTGLELESADRSTLSLDQLLEALPWNLVEPIARLFNTISLTPNFSLTFHSSISPADVPQEMRERLREALKHHPLLLFEMIRCLDPQARAVFLWLCNNKNGKASMQEVRAFPHDENRPLLSILHQLEAQLLAFDTLTATGERILFIPEELMKHFRQRLRSLEQDEQAHALVPVPAPPPIVQEGLPTLCYDFAVIIGSTYQTLLETTKDNFLPKRLRTKIRTLLHGQPRMRDGEDDYVEMLFHTALTLGALLCAPPTAGEKRRYQLGPRLSEWSQATYTQQMSRFLDWWAQSAHWDDVYPDGRIASRTYTVTSARTILLTHLKRCLPEQWYRIDSLLYPIWRLQPIPLYGNSYAQLALAERPSLQSSRETWMRQEGNLYQAMLTSTLYEAGIISLGSTQDGPAEFFSLTELGATILLDIPPHTPEARAERPLIVQPNFEVLLLTLEMPTLYQLVQWAEIKRIGPISTLTLTQRALLQGLAHGNCAEQILAFLAQKSQKPLPQNVTYTLRDWPKQYQEARLSEVILVELSSEQAVQSLERVLIRRPVVIRQLAPCIFALSSREISFLELRRLLERAGLAVHGQHIE